MRLGRVRVREQLKALVGSQGSVHSVDEALVDHNLLRLFAHEALSNAFKYAVPGSPIAVAARIAAGARRPTSGASVGGGRGGGLSTARPSAKTLGRQARDTGLADQAGCGCGIAPRFISWRHPRPPSWPPCTRRRLGTPASLSHRPIAPRQTDGETCV
eukprot:scaffold5506_cov114-Isochrysis_galbana.AAC.3